MWQYIKISRSIDDDHIIELALDIIGNIKYRNPINLSEHASELWKKNISLKGSR
ncbi:MAG: hypothetical protein PUF72_01470 [Clostridiales bacterium]|nr:hypothetical protein [Clostridiales bacterium]